MSDGDLDLQQAARDAYDAWLRSGHDGHLAAVKAAALVSIAESLARLAESTTADAILTQPVDVITVAGRGDGWSTCAECGRARPPESLDEAHICARCRMTAVVAAANPIPAPCACGDPTLPGTVHRPDGCCAEYQTYTEAE